MVCVLGRLIVVQWQKNVEDIVSKLSACVIEECVASSFVMDLSDNAVIRIKVGTARYVGHLLPDRQCIACRAFHSSNIESHNGPLDLHLSMLKQLHIDAIHAEHVSEEMQTNGIVRPDRENDGVQPHMNIDVTVHMDFVPSSDLQSVTDPWKTCPHIEGYAYDMHCMHNPVADCLVAHTTQARRMDSVGRAKWEHQQRSATQQKFVPTKSPYVLDTMVNGTSQVLQQLMTIQAMNSKSTADPRVLLQMCISDLSTCIQQNEDELNMLSIIYGPPGGGKTHYLMLATQILNDPRLALTIPAEKLPSQSIVARTATPQSYYQLGNPVPSTKLNVLEWSVDHLHLVLADCPEEYLVKCKRTGTPSLIPFLMALADEHTAERFRTEADKKCDSNFCTTTYKINGSATNFTILANIKREKLTKLTGVTETKPGHVPQPLLDRVANLLEFVLTDKTARIPMLSYSGVKFGTYNAKMSPDAYGDVLKNQEGELRQALDSAAQSAAGYTRQAALLLTSVDAIVCHWEIMGRHKGLFWSASSFIQAFCRVATPLRASDSRKQKALRRSIRIMQMYCACVQYLRAEWKGSSATTQKETSGDYVRCPVVSARNCLYRIAFADMSGVMSLACSQVFDTVSLGDRFMLNIVRLIKTQSLHMMIFGRESTDAENRKCWVHTGFVTTANGNSDTQTNFMQRVYLKIHLPLIDEEDEDSLTGNYHEEKSRSGKRNRSNDNKITQYDELRIFAEWLIVNWTDSDDESNDVDSQLSHGAPSIEEIVERLQWLREHTKAAAMCTAYVKRDDAGGSQWVVAPEYDAVGDDASQAMFKTASREELLMYGYKEQNFMQPQMRKVLNNPGVWSFAQDVIATNHLGEPNYKECQAPMCITLSSCALMMSLARFVGNPGLAQAYVKYANQIKSTVDKMQIADIVISPPEHMTKNFILAVLTMLSPVLCRVFEGALQENLHDLPTEIAMATVFDYRHLQQKRDSLYKDARDISVDETLLTKGNRDGTVHVPEMWWHMFACNVGENQSQAIKDHYRGTYRDVIVPFFGTGHGYPIGGMSTTGQPSSRTVYDVLQEALHCMTQAAEMRGPDVLDLYEDRTVNEYVQLLTVDLQFDVHHPVMMMRATVTRFRNEGMNVVEGMLPTDLQAKVVATCKTMKEVVATYTTNTVKPVAISMAGPDTQMHSRDGPSDNCRNSV